MSDGSIASNYADDDGHELYSSSRFYGTQPHVKRYATLEFPYANVDGVQVTPERARRFGQDLAYSIVGLLQAQSGVTP